MLLWRPEDVHTRGDHLSQHHVMVCHSRGLRVYQPKHQHLVVALSKLHHHDYRSHAEKEIRLGDSFSVTTDHTTHQIINMLLIKGVKNNSLLNIMQ